jgi:molybdopterin synthase catalytic subunit
MQASYHATVASETLIDVQLLTHPVDAVGFDPFPQPAGAECVFLGRTRREQHPRHGPLRRLSYEAYAPMARKQLDALARDAAVRFGCLAVRVHHAVGEVPPGGASVLVQVVCAHRAEAFEACRFLIDRLKATAPIWKREEWADGTTWSEGVVVDATEPPGGSP